MQSCHDKKASALTEPKAIRANNCETVQLISETLIYFHNSPVLPYRFRKFVQYKVHIMYQDKHSKKKSFGEV